MLGAGPAGAGWTDRRLGDRRQAGHLGRGAHLRLTPRTSRWPARTSSPTRSPNTATRPRSSSSWQCSARGPHPCSSRPHLVPLDQGELVELLRHPTRADRGTELRRALRRTPMRDEPFVEVADSPPGVRDVCETNFCRIFVAADEHTGQGGGALGDRQPLEGHILAGRAEPQPHVRLPRDGRFELMDDKPNGWAHGSARRSPSSGPPQPFFRSRWVPAPEHVQRTRPRRRAARGLPRGRGRLWDQAERQSRRRPARLRRAAPDQRRALHRHRRARRAGDAQPRALPPGRRARDPRQLRLRERRHRPAGAGRRRQDPGRRRDRRRAWRPSEVLLGSTGGISHQLPVEKMLRGILRRAPRLRRDGDARLPAGDPDDRRLREARQPRRSSCPPAPCA